MGIFQKMFHTDEWYDRLKKPSITPPKWAFPVVWTTLYIMIAASLIVYLNKAGISNKIPIIFFSLQMILNFAWAPLFFWAKMITFAMFECIAMWIFILLTIIYFHRESPLAAYLLIPYLIWVVVAAYLNIYVVIYNDDPSLEPEKPKNTANKT